MKSLLSLLAIVVLLSACKKDAEEDPIIPDPELEILPVYMPLNHGSYWVYDHYRIDTTGEETFQNKSDSLVIQRDSIVNGVSYAVLEGKTVAPGSEWRVIDLLRDSADCVVNLSGIPLFASENYVDTLFSHIFLNPQTSDTMYTIHVRMKPTPQQISVPAGNFDVINANGVFTAFQITHPEGHNPRNMPVLFAKDVGRVLDNYFFVSSPFNYERRLVRYHIGEKE